MYCVQMLAARQESRYVRTKKPNPVTDFLSPCAKHLNAFVRDAKLKASYWTDKSSAI